MAVSHMLEVMPEERQGTDDQANADDVGRKELNLAVAIGKQAGRRPARQLDAGEVDAFGQEVGKRMEGMGLQRHAVG